MSRRGDNIHKRKDGRWEGRYKCGIKENGTTKYRSVYGRTYTECKSKLNQCTAEIFLPKTKHTEWKFGDVLTLWLSSNRIRIKGSTENKYLNIIETHIMPELGGCKLSTLNSTVINSFLDKKLQEGAILGNGGLAPSYVKTIAIIIESALKYAAAEGMCPMLRSAIHKPSIPKQELTVFSKEFQRYFEDSIRTETTEVALGTLIALHTGMRIGEICALQWCDIDFESDMIFVRHTITRVKSTAENSKTMLVLGMPKTASSRRVIPISSVLKPILKKACTTRISEFVVSQTDTFVGTRTFDYRYRQMLKRHNLEVVGFHTIRHTFATRCIEAGMDVKTLSEILGHASASTTLNIYVHSSMENKRKQMEKLYLFA